MKKLMFVLAAFVMALSFASCKVDTSKVTVSVVDLENNPVKDRAVYYNNLASVIVDAATPAPDAPLTGEELIKYEHGETNAQGTVTFTFDLATETLNYYFYVLDEGSNQILQRTVKLQRGVNEEIQFQVNK